MQFSDPMWIRVSTTCRFITMLLKVACYEKTSFVLLQYQPTICFLYYVVHTEILMKKPHGAAACAVVCQWKVFLKTSHIFLSSRGVWFVPCLLPLHIPSWDKSLVGGLHPLMTNHLLSSGTLCGIILYFFSLLTSVEKNSSNVNRHMEG